MQASQDRKRIREYIAEQNLMAAIELMNGLIITRTGCCIKAATNVLKGAGHSPAFCSGL